jgi:molybdenum cofactor guanylyltransferase
VWLRAVEPMPVTGEDVARCDPAPPLAGVVLCGGLSRRMGADKATITVEGITLLERARTRLAQVCEPVSVAPGGLLLDPGGFTAVADAVVGAGPLGALVGALRWSPHRLLAVVAVDMPWLDPELLRLLAGRIGDADAAVCETARGLEPLHAVYARSVLAAAEAALGSADRSLHGLIERVRTVRVTAMEWRAAGITSDFERNLNTPADLAEFSPELSPPTS